MSLFVDIKKQFQNFKLDVSFSLDEGISGLLGASGSGKSLTLKCIAGIITPDEGRIVLNNRVLFDSSRNINLPVQKRNVGYLFQNYALFPNMTVEQNIKAGLRSQKKDKQRVNQLLLDYQLYHIRDLYPRQLSGGQQQRAALARIMATQPEVLLLDEPFSALDGYLKWKLSHQVYETLSKFEKTTLFVSHDKEEVQYLCDSVCIMENGLSQPIQSVEELFSRPQTVAACQLTGCKNISRVQRLEDGSFRAIDWGGLLYQNSAFPSDIDYIAIHADKIKLADMPGPNRIPCSVEHFVQFSFSGKSRLFVRELISRMQLQLEVTLDKWPDMLDKTQFWLEFPQNAIIPLRL